ncbi:MAG: HD domain-containing protein [Sulfuriferula multivorans]|uniref:HD domain-containing protein n=1 Tax=Sulfuriferula multivorans TaxID=1559896 RepID=A0A7C9P919_9PROT|nr:HD domain-containing protein [Sulfuriferula multivorans]
MTTPFLFGHEDRLGSLDQNVSLEAKVHTIHTALLERFGFIQHIAAAVYDPATDTLKTFLQIGGGKTPFQHFTAKLSEAPSLTEIIKVGRPRVVNDLVIFSEGPHEHSKRIAAKGYRASYTMPMYQNGHLFGFLFFNSYESDCFVEEVLGQIDPFGHLIALTIINDLTTLHTLLASVKTARDLTHARDGETGSHLDRMSRFARVIAQSVAEHFELTDEYIEKIFIFSPLHDIGKIAIPDRVLLKPGKLNPEEWALMQTHPIRGREIIDQMLTHFELGTMQGCDILRNIALFHHESVDGTGYPDGRTGEDIPIEARIVAVADIFDALTSRRPYKPAWSNDDAFDLLRKLAGKKLDAYCVDALIESRDEIEEIQQQFQENVVG